MCCDWGVSLMISPVELIPPAISFVGGHKGDSDNRSSGRAIFISSTALMKSGNFGKSELYSRAFELLL
jgi:hypothetical protein